MSNLLLTFDHTSNKHLSELSIPITFLIDISQYIPKDKEESSQKLIDTLEVYTILDLVYSKVKVNSKIMSKDHYKENTYKVSIDLNVCQYEKENPDMLLNVGSINMRFLNDEHDEKVIVMQIVKERSTFYKNIIL
jgi:hypothetical protein